MKRLNLIGKRFERLIVISLSGSDKRGKSIWNCLCDCGSYKNIEGSSLTYGGTRSCGCLQKESVRSLRKYKLIGKRFGWLTVLDELPYPKKRGIINKCLCKCGNICYVLSYSLIRGTTRSCGCLVKMANRCKSSDPKFKMKLRASHQEKVRNGTHHLLKDGEFSQISY